MMCKAESIEALGKFVEQDRSRFINYDSNRLGSAVSHLIRRREQLAVIFRRYQIASPKVAEKAKAMTEKMKQEGAGPRPITPDEFEEMKKDAKFYAELHLDIESFYIFANILLDEAACLLEFYFGKSSYIKDMSNFALSEK